MLLLASRNGSTDAESSRARLYRINQPRYPRLLREAWSYVVTPHTHPIARMACTRDRTGTIRQNRDQDISFCVTAGCLVNACISQLQFGNPIWCTADVRYDFSSSRGVGELGLYNVDGLLNLRMHDSSDKAARMIAHNTAPVHAMLINGREIGKRCTRALALTELVGKGGKAR